jgi:hypothetical protein
VCLGNIILPLDQEQHGRGTRAIQVRIPDLNATDGRVEERKFNPTRAKRQPFLANVIVTEVETGNQMPGLIRNLSLSGCYVETAAAFSPGVNVRLIISHNDEKFRAFGKIIHAAASKGMGIVFISTLPDDEVILQGWMARLRES